MAYFGVPRFSIASLKSTDTEFEGSRFFADKRKQYIAFLDRFIGSTRGITSEDLYKTINKTTKTIKKNFNEQKKEEKDLYGESLEEQLREMVDSNFPQADIDRLQSKITRKKEAIKLIRTNLEQLKILIGDLIIAESDDRLLNHSSYLEITKKILSKLIEYDKIKYNFTIRIVVSTINYILTMSRSTLWAKDGKKIAPEFFRSFDKFFTEDKEDEDNTEEIIKNCHEMLLRLVEKYKLTKILDSDEKMSRKFYKVLLLMHRYPVNIQDTLTTMDVITGLDKTESISQYLNKNQGNIVIKLRDEFLRDSDESGKIVKKPIYIFTKRTHLSKLLDNEERTFYGCKKIEEERYVPLAADVDKTIKYVDNIDIKSVGNKFWDISIIRDDAFKNHQLFVLQNLEEGFVSYTTVSASKGRGSVVSAWRCQIPAPKGTAKLLIGIPETSPIPTSISPGATPEDISPLSDYGEFDILTPAENRRRSTRTAIVDYPDSLPRPVPSSAQEQQVPVRRGPGRPRTNPLPSPENEQQVPVRRGPGRPRTIPLPPPTQESPEQSPPPSPPPVQEQAAEQSPPVQRRRGRPPRNSNNVTRRRRIGAVCEVDADCVNGNCVNNRCTRREYGSQSVRTEDVVRSQDMV